MMGDPMFMIVQSLTAVTPTAVAPIAVILHEFTRLYLTLPDFTCINLYLLEFIRIYWNLPEFT